MTIEQVFVREDGFSPDEAFFDGHFPTAPIVPGAILLAEAERCLLGIGKRVHHIARIKFLKTVRPNQPLDIRVAIDAETARLTWETPDGIAARANIRVCDV